MNLYDKIKKLNPIEYYVLNNGKGKSFIIARFKGFWITANFARRQEENLENRESINKKYLMEINYPRKEIYHLITTEDFKQDKGIFRKGKTDLIYDIRLAAGIAKYFGIEDLKILKKEKNYPKEYAEINGWYILFGLRNRETESVMIYFPVSDFPITATNYENKTWFELAEKDLTDEDATEIVELFESAKFEWPDIKKKAKEMAETIVSGKTWEPGRGLAGRKYPKGKAPKRKAINKERHCLTDKEINELKKKCGQFILNSINDIEQDFFDCTALVTDENLSKINEMLKTNIKKVYIVSNNCRHTNKRHGEGYEEDETQHPLNVSDYLKFPDIIENPDKIKCEYDAEIKRVGIKFRKYYLNKTNNSIGETIIVFTPMSIDDIMNITGYRHKLGKCEFSAGTDALVLFIPLTMCLSNFKRR